MRRVAVLLTLLLAAALVPAVAGAARSWTGPFARVASNPADKLAALPIEAFRYDRATGCRRGATPGATALARWLARNSAGSAWGINRCERWGKRSASLHAEGRALDWHLDAAVPAQRRAARRLIAVLLAPDSKGRPAALARRMGIQGIIFDCKAWFGSGDQLRNYSACRRRVDRTTAHRDHLHLELTKKGAAKRTSFWTRRAPALADREDSRDLEPEPEAEPGTGDDEPFLPDLGLPEPGGEDGDEMVEVVEDADPADDPDADHDEP